MKLSDFHFELPQSSIATSPASPKDSARLLEFSSSLNDFHVSQLPELLRKGDVLVVNDTKVIPAKLQGKRGAASVTITLHQELLPGTWKAFAKPAKKLQLHDRFVITEDFWADIIDKGRDGEITLAFNVKGADFYAYLSCYGEMPIPPYIKRPNDSLASDKRDYQTVYAAHEGAVAAPTAGLHFTDSLLEKIKAKGVDILYVTLHVGAGTFLPVKVDNITDHKMHSENYMLSQETADKINLAKQEGRRIIAVGTTSLRVLESAADENNILYPFSGETSIFITPGYRFKMVDMLFTNFHLPCSTLLMLVCAFAGREKIFQAYQHAIASGYRFYSYGDACLLYKANK